MYSGKIAVPPGGGGMYYYMLFNEHVMMAITHARLRLVPQSYE
jgi:PHP family Zn ribbon phosphoesterase